MLQLRFLFFLALFIPQYAVGQEVLWEKKFGWSSSHEQFYDGISIDNELYALGTTDRFGAVYNGTFYPGVVVLKFTGSGDTLWLKPVGYQSRSVKICKGENDLFYIVASIAYSSPTSLQLICLNSAGTVIFSLAIPDTEDPPVVEKFIRTSDGNMLLTGSRQAIQGTGNQQDMFAIKLDLLGNVIWNNRYSSHPYCSGNQVEETPEGHYILSGNAGSKIWRLEVDSAGNVVDDDFLYQTPSAVIFDQTAAVTSHPFSSNILTGRMNGATTRFYLGRHTISTNQKMFGGEKPGGVGRPFVNNDGNFWLTFGSTDSTNLKKLNQDSVVLANIPLRGRMGAFGAGIDKLIYLPDSSAIGVGALGYLTSLGTDFYFCRIKNVGVPYDPQNPNTAVKNKTKRENLEPYPNPVASSLVFKGLKESGMLYLFDLRGQIIKQLQVKPYQRVYLSDLPAGLYPYRIQTVNHVYTGKIIKE